MTHTAEKNSKAEKPKSGAANGAANGSARQGLSSPTSTKNGVPANTSAAQGLRNLFLDELKDIYWAEKALTKAIPAMIKQSTSPALVKALTGHLDVTIEHEARLEKVFAVLGEKAVAVKCQAMEGLIKEADQIMTEAQKGIVRDTGIISAAQKVEHYEIATYGTLCAFAKTLGEHEVASILHLTLHDEKQADDKLSEIAYSMQLEMVDEDSHDATAMVSTINTI